MWQEVAAPPSFCTIESQQRPGPAACRPPQAPPSLTRIRLARCEQASESTEWWGGPYHCLPPRAPARAERVEMERDGGEQMENVRESGGASFLPRRRRIPGIRAGGAADRGASNTAAAAGTRRGRRPAELRRPGVARRRHQSVGDGSTDSLGVAPSLPSRSRSESGRSESLRV